MNATGSGSKSFDLASLANATKTDIGFYFVVSYSTSSYTTFKGLHGTFEP